MGKNTLNFHFEDFGLFEDLTDEEVGKVTRGLIQYAMTGEEPEFEDRLVRSVFRHLISRHDKDVQAYQDKCDRNRENVQKRWNTTVCDGKENDTTVYDRKESNTNYTDRIGLDKNRLDKIEKKESIKKEKTTRHKHGEFQHVLLTEQEYKKLVEDYGEDRTSKAIKKVDEYCERMGKSYKNYNLVLRNWGFEGIPKPRESDEVMKKLGEAWIHEL